MHLIDSSDQDLDAFQDACQRLGGFNDRVDGEWADGYLTAMMAGPRTVPFDEWIVRMAGDAFERAFADPEDQARARAALEGRARVLANHLDPEALLDQPEALRLQPVVALWDDALRDEVAQAQKLPPEEVAMLLTGALWAQGFFDAIDDFADDWQPHGVDEAEQALYEELASTIAVLMLPEDDERFKAYVAEHWKEQLPTREDLVDDACFAVQDLRVWWLDHAPRPATRHVAPTPGRNDPCPCGSGQKYKKCHGKSA